MDSRAERTAFLAAQTFNTQISAVKRADWTSPIINNPAVTGVFGLRRTIDRGVGQVGGWLADRKLNQAMTPGTGAKPGGGAGFGQAFSSASGQYGRRGFMGYLQMIFDMLLNRRQFGQQAALGQLSQRAQQNSQWWNPKGYFYRQTLKNRQQAYGQPRGFFTGQS